MSDNSFDENNFDSMDNEQVEIVQDTISKKRKAIKIILLILLIIFLVAAGIFIYSRLAKSEVQPAQGGIGLYYDPNAKDYTQSTTVTTTKRGVKIPGWPTINIPENHTEIAVDFYNPKENEGLYYLTFELRLPDDSKQGYEVLYKSGLVEPSKHIQSITLSHGFDKGEYDAVVHVQPYRMDEDKTPTNNADMKTKLVVK